MFEDEEEEEDEPDQISAFYFLLSAFAFRFLLSTFYFSLTTGPAGQSPSTINSQPSTILRRSIPAQHPEGAQGKGEQQQRARDHRARLGHHRQHHPVNDGAAARAGNRHSVEIPSDDRVPLLPIACEAGCCLIRKYANLRD